MAQIKIYNKNANVTYVYDSKCYFDEEAQKFKEKRKLLGKIDPETGEMVPTGKRGPKPKGDRENCNSVNYFRACERNEALLKDLEEAKGRIMALEIELREKNDKLEYLAKVWKKNMEILGEFSDILDK